VAPPPEEYGLPRSRSVEQKQTTSKKGGSPTKPQCVAKKSSIRRTAIREIQRALTVRAAFGGQPTGKLDEDTVTAMRRSFKRIKASSHRKNRCM